MMFDTDTLQTLLNPPDIAIDRVVLAERRTLEIHVHSTLEGMHYHRCGKPIDHGYVVCQEIALRHLPVFDYNTVLVLRPKRYQYRSCEGRPTTSQTLSWCTPRASVTKAFEQQMLLELINSTLEDVSLKHAIGVDALQGILDRRIEPEVNWNGIETLEVIGIDEIALKKGHRDFVVVISAYVNDRLRVIALLPARTKAVVNAFFRSIPKRLWRTVAVVCSDLFQGFIRAAKAVFGKRVLICADRFHVARLYREGLETLRKREFKRLRRTLSKASLDELKNAHWVLRHRRADLNADERRLLNRLFAHPRNSKTRMKPARLSPPSTTVACRKVKASASCAVGCAASPTASSRVSIVSSARSSPASRRSRMLSLAGTAAFWKGSTISSKPSSVAAIE